MITLVDLIFKGSFSNICFDFLNNINSDFEDRTFIFPENVSIKTFDNILNIFKLNDYVDFKISAKTITFNNIILPNVFVNIGRDNNDVEMLLFFDVKDICENFNQGLTILQDWAITFKNTYNFDAFFCQTDGTNYEEEYFFKSN